LANPRPAAPKTDLFAAVTATSAAQSLCAQLEVRGVACCPGVAAAAQPFLVALLEEQFPTRTIVVVTDGLKSQENFHADLTTWQRLKSGAKSSKAEPLEPKAEARLPLFYPPWDILPHEHKLPHSDIISERLETLVALANPGPAALVVTSVTALLQRTFPAPELRAKTRSLRRGDTINPLDLIEWLEEVGYEPEAQVTSKGELSWRGGIVDVWPLCSPWPVRLEFFGDELESLREFDPHTQLSREQIETIMLPPAGELGLLKKRGTRTTDLGLSEIPPPTINDALASLFDYLPGDALFVLCEPDALLDHALRYRQQVPPGDAFFFPWDDFLAAVEQRGFTRLDMTEVGADEFTPDLTPALSPEERENDSQSSETASSSLSPAHPLAEKLTAFPPLLGGEGRGEGETRPPSDQTTSSLTFNSLDAFRPIAATLPEPQVAEAQRREFFAQLHRWGRQGHRVHVFCNNEGERQRFGELWQEYGFGGEVQSRGGAVLPDDLGLGTSDIRLSIGTLARGFIQLDAKLVVVTDAEIFGRYKVQRPRRLKSPHAQAMRSAFEVDFTEFEEGDYVVHLQHGVGIFRGLRTLPPVRNLKPHAADSKPTGGGQECLVIEFAAGDTRAEPPKLYVPVTEAHLVSKYVGAGKARPQLNTLGGTRWTKAKEHAQKAVRDLAGELLSVQAARAAQPGHSFAADAPWQREFESAFLYEETPDQVKAIDATKRDMEIAKPMDRLICGDVGFGKTEVAIRAAFKAVLGGKQVALLVPTTVLAQQHYNNFRERMADYPVRIELLSRYRTPKQQRAVLEAAAAGTVDIIIGTHRIVQADSAFKELGLVIVDEEQKFGVKHKEQFKLLRKTVDVLTLSATPIPRTLYLALTGARDLSTLETPPQDRLPVETVVGNYDERVIRDAIARELERGGQVYFVHNRISTIEAIALKLKALVPDARVVIGHGQMDADDLEQVMTQFVNGDADVLVSTTIIESGLDIPNANTIIIDRADRFGLSELYQLRGRVGRYKHQAYCHLLLPRHAQLLTEARKRMSAIKQYSALGSGFKIAMRDLEIRGAGNLLGPQQSGHITAVGFELYCQLLQQSIAAFKGEKVKPRVDVRVALDFLATNPGEEGSAKEEGKRQREEARPKFTVNIPRDDGVATYFTEPSETSTTPRALPLPIRKAPAYLPLDYIREPAQRLEIYRRLAQATDRTSLDAVKRELTDRFGPPPEPVELLLIVGELKLLAAERRVTGIEVVEDKVKLTRNGELFTVGGHFPRLAKRDARARLGEIKKLLLALA
jgi:transcription-repair coupling factor (superfamily II helicase)